MATAYKPTEDLTCLKDEAGCTVQVSRSFLLASTSPILSLTNPPVIVPPGPAYTVFAAHRVTGDMIVEGIRRSTYVPVDGDSMHAMGGQPSRLDKVTEERGLLPEGSLLLRAFDVATRTVHGPWYALTPEQNTMQNLQRVTVSNDGIVSSSIVSSAHAPQFQVSAIKYHGDLPPDQKDAHLDDAVTLRQRTNPTFLDHLHNWRRAFG